jgi:hypothetical protein
MKPAFVGHLVHRLDRRGLEIEGQRHCPHGSFHHPKALPILFDHFIVAVLLPAGVRLSARETRLRVHMERRERVGHRHGCDVGLLVDG